MRAIGTNYKEAFGKIESNYGYTIEEMLVVIKAFEVYRADSSSGKSSAEVGWLDEFYDVPGVPFQKTMLTVYPRKLQEIAPELWEEGINGKIRLSAEGLSFLEKEAELVESASQIVRAVTQIRRF